MKPGLTIVISPLIALMDDQIQNLKKRGIRAESLNSSAGIVEQRKIMEDLSGRGGITELLKLQKLVKKRIYKDLHIPEIPNFDVFKEDLKTLTEDTFDKLTEFIVNLSLDFEVKEDHQEFKDFLVTIQERKQPIKLLYIAPETLLKKEVTELINNSIDISLIVLDEAHCFKEDTFVDTLEGPLTFKELNSRFKNSVQLPLVKSFNVKTQNFEYKKILNVFENPFKQLQRTLVKGGSIDSTPCHVFFTSDGEKPAKDLQVGDKILSSNVVKNQIQYSEVVSTRLLRVVNKPQYLYDIEIEDNHNYFVYTKSRKQHNTLLVHNCISSWGTSFRPKYVEIAKVREIFKPVPILALTATADTITRKDIINVLKFKDETTDVYLHPVDRPNISYAVYQKTEEYRQVLKLVQKYSEDTCGLIYCMSRDKAEKMQMFLTEYGIACEFFHAGMKVADKKRVQEAYLNKELNLIIATVAFGMGIDRSDVRYVINVDIPNSVEEFSQMSGRASRDGLPADSYVLYSRADANTAQWLLRKSMKNPERLQINSAKITKMVHFCETLKCRRASILKYFGENPSDTYKCGNCNATCCTK